MSNSLNFGWWLHRNFFFFVMFFLLCMKPLNNFIYFRVRICTLIIFLVPKSSVVLFNFMIILHLQRFNCSHSEFHDYLTKIKQFFMCKKKRTTVPVLKLEIGEERERQCSSGAVVMWRRRRQRRQPARNQSRSCFGGGGES
jgi:hypothetical protein